MSIPVLCACTGLFLGACTAGGSDPAGVAWVPPGEERVRLGPPLAVGRQVRSQDTWQIETYLRSESDHGRLELIYAEADPDKSVALDFGLTIDRHIRQWARLRGATITWLDRGQVGPPGRRLFYRTFELENPDLACFGFSGSWDLFAGDPQRRPGRVAFGYHCAPRLAPPGRHDPATILAAIRFGRTGLPAAPTTADPDAARFAAGGDDDQGGQPEFPYRFARQVNIGNGRRSP